MKTIVAATDFTPVSLNAVNYAANMALAVNAMLSIIYVSPLPMAFSEVPVPPQGLDELILSSVNQMKQLKIDLDILHDGKLKIYTEVKAGMILSEIKSICENLQPHAIVMGSQGAGVIERLIFGNVASSAITSLPSPLIIVPPKAKFESIKKIGLACDLKNVTKTFPLQQIKLLIQDFKAELYVVHVNQDNEECYDREIMEETEDLQNMLQDLHPSYHFLNNTGVNEGLTQFAERNKLDLLIVVPKKHNIIGKILHRSHSKQVAMHSQVPIMAVHEQIPKQKNVLMEVTNPGELEES
jgi:nucleotide-binding universal stress UspA family protein